MLPGKAQQEHIGGERVAEELFGQGLRVASGDRIASCGVLYLGQQAGAVQVGVRVGDKGRGWDLVEVDRHAGATARGALQGIVGSPHDQVTHNHGVGLLGVDAGLIKQAGLARQAYKGDHGAALLRKAHEVQHGRALAFEMRGRGDQGADGDDAGAANAGDDQVIGRIPVPGRWFR